MQSLRCPQCGSEAQQDSSFCSICGTSLSTIEPALRNLISPNRVILMTVLSAGLYVFYWFYITWKQYRDHTGEEAFPVWHALTLFVPIYGLFRTHAHVRTYGDLMFRRDLLISISPATAVWAMFISSVLDNFGFRASFGEITEGVAIAVLVTTIASTIITVWLLVSVQNNLNKFWQSVSSSASSARIGVGEIIFSVIGVLTWIDTVLTITSESYRAGF